MMQTLKKLFFISRPVSWVNTAYPFAAAYLVTGGTNWTLLVVATLFFLIPYNLLMYGINDVFDYESDMKNPRKGGIEGAMEQKSFHPTILIASIGFTLPFFFWLLLQGTILANIVLSIVLFFVVAYSLKYLRFKEIPLLDSMTSSIHFVGPMIYGLVLTENIHTAWPIVVAFFFWGMASHALGAIQDIIPDREGNLSSVATAFGASKTLWFVIILYLASSLLIATQGTIGIIVGLTSLLYVLNCLPYRNVSDATSMTVHTAWRRFIWLNLVTGFVITISLIISAL